jgi:vacuolar-type H+-ATPase subunit H
MEQFNELEAIINAAREDAVKFFVKSNKAAGKRLRKSMQELKVAAQKIRINVSETNKSE